MPLVKTLCTTLSIFYFSINILAQADLIELDPLHCGSAIINNQRLAEDPSLQQIIEARNAFSKTYEKHHVNNKMGEIYYLPVVYHIIHNNGSENVSKATIETSIQNLNEDFRKLNANITNVIPAFAGITADCEIEFRLAHKDPDGNCTEGITRTQSELTYAGGEQVKNLVNWDTKKYLNIWVVETVAGGSGGYAYYPGTAPSQSQEGIVIRSAQLGNSLTHEVGHYLNLSHCWGNSNTPGLSINCGQDDDVSDTPVTLGNISCNTGAISCGSLDNVQNYMDYAACRAMFTGGQKTRMHAALNSSWGSRNTLWTNSNLIATGTNDPYGPVVCAPIANFSYNEEFICEGSSVTYSDDSYNATPTSWNWTFEGGTPNTSAVSNPTITYNVPGVFGTTHEPSTVAGSGSLTITKIITVSSLTADYSGPLTDGFENETNFNNDWIILDPSSGQKFQRTTEAAASGSAAIRILNFATGVDGLKDELISPSYDLSTISDPILTFKHAFARKNNTADDRLFVSWSINCGESWSLKLPVVGANLETTTSFKNSFWYPNSNEWGKKTLDLSQIANETNVRFKFAFESSGAGNNLFLDDINIDGATAIDDLPSTIGSFSVHPNPSSTGKAIVTFNLIENVGNLQIRLLDVLGKEVTNIINNQSFNPGKYTLAIDKKHQLEPGVYFIQFNADERLKTQKLIIQ